ncbi:hypothetical protein [Kitasatospora sp. KL5]|uniref:hypothetical protein n=1 Tax=Kitasatospora sp. KL5 TaxID=3425125 RepID=UPI003D6FA4A3
MSFAHVTMIMVSESASTVTGHVTTAAMLVTPSPSPTPAVKVLELRWRGNAVSLGPCLSLATALARFRRTIPRHGGR